MTTLQVSPPFNAYFGVDGKALSNGMIYIGKPGLNPETNPISVYWDEGLTVPAAQPVRTIGGYPSRNGTPGALYAGQRYSITVRDASGVVVYSQLVSGQSNLSGLTWAQLQALTYDDVAVGQLIEADGWSYVVAASGATDNQITGAGGVKFYVLDPDVRAFGVGRGGDDTAAVNAFWAWISATDVGIATFAGNIAVNGLITAGPSSGTIATKMVRFGATVTGSGTHDLQWLWRGTANLVCSGFMIMNGAGSANDYGTWTINRAVGVNGDCKHMVWPALELHKYRDFGVDLNDDGVGGDLISFMTFGPIDGDDIGLRIDGGGVTAVTLTSAPVNNGTSGTNTQTATLEVSSVPAAVGIGSLCKVGTRVCYISAIAGTTLTVFPWVESTVVSGDPVKFMHGALVRVTGNDANLARFSMIRGTRCNTPLIHDASYNLTADRVYAQFCSTPMIVGNTPSAAVFGFSITSLGGEASTEFPPIILTRALQGGQAQGYPLSKWYGAHRAGVTGDLLANTISASKGVEFCVTTSGAFTQQWNKPRNYLAATATANVISNGPQSAAVLANSDPDIAIKWNADNNDQWGYSSVDLTWAAASVAVADNFEIVLDATDVTDGWKIDMPNGAFSATSMTINSAAHPFMARVVADVTAKRWTVCPASGDNILPVRYTYDPPSLGAGASTTNDISMPGVRQSSRIEVKQVVTATGALSALTVTAAWLSDNVVRVTYTNGTGGTLNEGTGTVWVRAW